MQQTTFQSLLLKGIERFGELPAITLLPAEETLTYRELLEKSRCIAEYLLCLGVEKGTHVATLIPNSLENVLFNIAITQCGATLIPLGEKLGIREVDYILKESQPKIVIMGTNPHIQTVHEYLEGAEDGSVHVIGLPGFDIHYPETFEVFRWQKQSAFLDLPIVLPDDIALLSYTGGTTGTPKGVMHSQKGLGAAMISACIEDPLDDQDRLLLSTPLVHSAGSILWRSLLSGVHVYIMRGFQAEHIMNAIKDYRITTTFMVPTMLYRLLDLTKKMKYDVSSLRNIYYGASPISQERLKEAFEVFGPVIRQQYGMTECNIVISRFSKSAHMWAFHNKLEALKSCGKPCLMTEVRIIDDYGNDVKPLENGEIIIKSPAMMAGYYQRPELTKKVIRDGWLYTGDIGKRDESGFLYIVDRKKDMIISGGMNVYSAEVERVVNQHPAVSLCTCIGIPHPDWGEAVCVIVSKKKGVSCTEEDIIHFCRQNTSKYMVPKEIYFRDTFPLTTIGKIDKKELKKIYSQQIVENR
ncbi:AMP-dependent synthetase [Bacillus cereus]|uniref:class I adenylate-forming enzyme family protein n=1 Tax=Bacillus paramycoides TaxID=2026194 RepID=UPI000BF52854|nr:class I adenylate-forming enzyme family protein [Bacillus paramycoides]PFD45334.1 AMP-dependent synthetase [Bacillus cereus]